VERHLELFPGNKIKHKNNPLVAWKSPPLKYPIFFRRFPIGLVVLSAGDKSHPTSSHF